MSNSSSVGCIAPNPDIAGIGIRYSVYFQSFLFSVYPIYMACNPDRLITQKDIRTMNRATITAVIGGSALLFNSFIQLYQGLSLYHSLIILQLNWLYHLTYSTMQFHWLSHYLQPGQSYDAEQTETFSTELMASAAHSSMLGFFGFITFCEMNSSETPDPCSNGTVLVMLTRNIYREFVYQINMTCELTDISSIQCSSLLADYPLPILCHGTWCTDQQLHVRGGVLDIDVSRSQRHARCPQTVLAGQTKINTTSNFRQPIHQADPVSCYHPVKICNLEPYKTQICFTAENGRPINPIESHDCPPIFALLYTRQTRHSH